MQQYGSIIKQYRKEKGYTLKTLAEKAGVSIGFLSKIEHGTSNLSYENLQNICYALDISSAVFENKKEGESDIAPQKIDKAQRTLIYSYKESGVLLENLFSNENRFDVTILTLYGGKCSQGTARHTHTEFGIVIRGTLVVEIDKTEYTVQPEECILIPKGTEHITKKAGKDDCVSVWVRYR